MHRLLMGIPCCLVSADLCSGSGVSWGAGCVSVPSVPCDLLLCVLEGEMKTLGSPLCSVHVGALNKPQVCAVSTSKDKTLILHICEPIKDEAGS